MSVCKTCGKEHNGFFGSGIYCSKRCAHVPSKELAKQIGESLKERGRKQKEQKEKDFEQSSESKKICPKCGIGFVVDYAHKTKIFCSRQCSNSREWTLEKRKKLSETCKKSEKVLVSNRNRDYGKKHFIECPICKKSFEAWVNSKTPRIYCSKKCYYADSDHLYCKKPSGGLRKGSGLGIKGYYKGFYCRSTWELAWLVYQLDNNVSVIQCKEYFEYMFNGEKHKYYPDFIIDDIFYEIKGYKTPQVEEKIKQFPKDKKLIMIEGKKQLKPFIDYTIEKYGKRFWEMLYENKLK